MESKNSKHHDKNAADKFLAKCRDMETFETEKSFNRQCQTSCGRWTYGSFEFTSALHSKRKRQISTWPKPEDKCKGDLPALNTGNYNVQTEQKFGIHGFKCFYGC
jgi:hypothetical protein